MELIRTGCDSNMLRFTYYVKPECEAKKFKGGYYLSFIKNNCFFFVLFFVLHLFNFIFKFFKLLKIETNTEMFEKGNLIVFTNDFFTIYKCSQTGKSIIALNEIS